MKALRDNRRPNSLQLIDVDGRDIVSKNLAGRETKHPNVTFSTKGRRTFGVLIDNDELVKDLMEDGWKVKNMDIPDRLPIIYVNLNYDTSLYPPKVYICIGEEEYEYVDAEDLYKIDEEFIESADIQIHKSVKTGSAYLEKAYFILEENEFEARHRRRATRPMEDFDVEEE